MIRMAKNGSRSAHETLKKGLMKAFKIEIKVAQIPTNKHLVFMLIYVH